MGKTSKWLRNLLIGKNKKEKDRAPVELLRAENLPAPIPVPATKEKKRWSFRRSVGAARELNSPEPTVTASCLGLFEPEIDQNRHALAVAVATAAAADAAVAAAQAAAAVVRLTVAANERTARAIEEEAAIKIQSIFRSHLARKALCALKGLVKLQALVRGHLVRKQATATFRCMQALVNAQARAVAQRIRMVEESQTTPQKQLNYRRSPQQSRFRHSFEMNENMEEFVKIVEMDLSGMRSNSKSRSSYSLTPTERSDLRFCSYNSATHTPRKADVHPQFSPAPSALTELSPRGCSGHFDEFSFATAQSSPHMSAMSMPTHNSFDYPLYPNYMANTESSRAKARSQSAPKQRLDAYERQSSRRRPSVEGRNIPRVIKMQRSASHVALTLNSYQYPWSIKLDKSNLSLKGSECGSTSTIPTNINY